MLIGKRRRVQDIRLVWKQENDFSDWLVTEDGISLLAEELGLELENLVRESSTGIYRCDIVGNLLGEEQHIVVIENQYGRTNHDHLGKLLTYAAAHKAMTGIWISESISDEHRQVIDWLNENTPTNVNLYLVALQIYQIGDSPVAPQLDVVCRPNQTLKESRSGLSVADQERHSWRLRMWTEIHEEIQKSKPPFRLSNPGHRSYSKIKIGRSGFHISLLLTPKRECIGIMVYLTSPWSESALAELQLQRSQIEVELDASLQWLKEPDSKRARILLEAKIDPRKPENEPLVKEWFAANTPKMFRTFRDRVLALEEPGIDE
jgi:hypothetical protein